VAGTAGREAVVSARDQMLSSLRRALGRGAPGDRGSAAVEQRLAHPARGVIPARAALPHAQQVELFCTWATSNNATVARVSAAEVPAAVADYLSRNNLPSQLVAADSPEIGRYDWSERPLLELRRGVPVDADRVALTGAFAGVAETGTLVMTSGPEHPVSLNLLPETHVVVLREGDIVGTYEDVWDRLRQHYGAGQMPRTVNTITGPSRTADIEQTLELGAHGPRRMHIVVVRD
jgi:L-lactate dehydrogenase complex protein LldG